MCAGGQATTRDAALPGDCTNNARDTAAAAAVAAAAGSLGDTL